MSKNRRVKWDLYFELGDVDRVRAALGDESIRLVGHSGGSQAGIEVVRSFGERVDRFVAL